MRGFCAFSESPGYHTRSPDSSLNFPKGVTICIWPKLAAMALSSRPENWTLSPSCNQFVTSKSTFNLERTTENSSPLMIPSLSVYPTAQKYLVMSLHLETLRCYLCLILVLLNSCCHPVLFRGC